MLNYDWLLDGEAGDALLGYSSLIWVGGWFQAHFQLRPDDDDAPSSVYGGLILRGSLRGSAEGGRFSLPLFFWEGWEPGQGSS